MQVMLKDNLQCEGYDVISAETGERGLELGLSQQPDLILLDVILPRISGYSVCQKLRKAGFSTPILMITARNTEIDRITGLDFGADDYISKPFSVSELMARVRAHLRRSERLAPDPQLDKLVVGSITIDTVRREVFRGLKPVNLSSREIDLLLYMIGHAGETISRDQLLRDVWGYPELPLTRTVDVFVARLRGKIEDKPHQPRHITTVHGIGYRFVK